MAAEQENSEQASTLLGKHKRQVLAGAAVVLVSLGALWAYLMWGAVKPETVVAEPVIGVLDMQQLIKAHPDYGRLQEIQRDIDHLENALALEDIKLPQTAPTPEKELFQEAAGQKSRLDSLARHDQLVHQLNAMAEKKRQELRPKFEAEHQEAEQKYLNEMLNLRIKIDSADVLGLTPEQVQEILCDAQALDGPVEVETVVVKVVALDRVGVGHDDGKAGDELKGLPEHILQSQIVGVRV